MLAIKRILCPTDFSRFAQSALPIACALARDYGATLVMLHVRPVATPVMGEFGALPPEPRETDTTLQLKLRRLVPDDYLGHVECLVRDGNAVEEILRVVREGTCDMVVLPTHGRTGLMRLIVGSVAEGVLRGAPCPVLTIKPTPIEEAVPPEAVEREPNVNADELRTVCSVSTALEADVIRNALHNEGIHSFIDGQQQGGWSGMLSFPVKIQVRPRDADRASKFIRQREEHRR